MARKDVGGEQIDVVATSGTPEHLHPEVIQGGCRLAICKDALVVVLDLRLHLRTKTLEGPFSLLQRVAFQGITHSEIGYWINVATNSFAADFESFPKRSS